MSGLADLVQTSLRAALDATGTPPGMVVALSGGRDSSVLLHVLCRADNLPAPVRAVHVNHGLHAAADDWQRHCEAFAATLNIECRAVAVTVGAGDGPEAAARAARYAALAGELAPGEWLLTAHHAGDQAETLLLNLMRGSGADGLRGAAALRPFAPGVLLRPLLDADPADIDAYARDHRLEWLDDPSNDDDSLDRNFLRHRVVPLLQQRWPAAARQIATSARLLADAADLARALATQDLVACGDAGRLSLAALANLDAARRANVLRYACRELGLPLPTRRALATIDADLLAARGDRNPCVAWGGAEARRYRGHVYLMRALDDNDEFADGMLRPGEPLVLAHGELRLVPCASGGIAARLAEDGLQLRARSGGETLPLGGNAGSKSLKKLLQERGVVPWMRARVPLLYAGDRLVAVGDLWAETQSADLPGFRVAWRNRPALF